MTIQDGPELPQAGRRGTEEAHAARWRPASAAGNSRASSLRGDITGPEADWAIASYLARSAAALRHAPGPGRRGGGSAGGDSEHARRAGQGGRRG